MYDIALGLEAIHKAGIVHGDLKAANILIYDGDGQMIAKYPILTLVLLISQLKLGIHQAIPLIFVHENVLILNSGIGMGNIPLICILMDWLYIRLRILQSRFEMLSRQRFITYSGKIKSR